MLYHGRLSLGSRSMAVSDTCKCTCVLVFVCACVRAHACAWGCDQDYARRERPCKMPLAACRRGHACLRVGRFPVAANTADVAVRRVWHLPTQSRHIGLRRTPIRQSPARTWLLMAHVALVYRLALGYAQASRPPARHCHWQPVAVVCCALCGLCSYGPYDASCSIRCACVHTSDTRCVSIGLRPAHLRRWQPVDVEGRRAAVRPAKARKH